LPPITTIDRSSVSVRIKIEVEAIGAGGVSGKVLAKALRCTLSFPEVEEVLSASFGVGGNLLPCGCYLRIRSGAIA